MAFGESRAENEIYHFLVPDPSTIPTHSDKLMRSFWPEHCASAKKWLGDNAKPKWKAEETTAALEVCDLVDYHWQQYAAERTEALAGTECTSTVWPVPSDSYEAIVAGPTLVNGFDRGKPRQFGAFKKQVSIPLLNSIELIQPRNSTPNVKLGKLLKKCNAMMRQDIPIRSIG